jgi:branched-chain amino acid transport system substrate-binding protein
MRVGFARLFHLLLAAAALVLALLPADAANDDLKPIRIGFSMPLTGGVVVNGKQVLLALEIWRDDINAKGGLLKRPVESSTTTTRATQPQYRASTQS